MAIYLSMQRVRFSSADGYEKFELLFGEVRNQLKTLPGFLHLTWWIHPKDPSRYNECSMWTSLEALRDWHMNMYHKQAKAYDLRLEQAALAEPCAKCGFTFPVMPETADSTAVFKDVAEVPLSA